MPSAFIPFKKMSLILNQNTDDIDMLVLSGITFGMTAKLGMSVMLFCGVWVIRCHW